MIIKTNSVDCNQIKPTCITQQMKTVLKYFNIVLLIHCMEWFITPKSVLNPYYCVKMNDLIHKCNVINTLRICSLTWKSSSLSFFFNKSSLRLSPTLYNYATRLSQNEHKISVRSNQNLPLWKVSVKITFHSKNFPFQNWTNSESHSLRNPRPVVHSFWKSYNNSVRD